MGQFLDHQLGYVGPANTNYVGVLWRVVATKCYLSTNCIVYEAVSFLSGTNPDSGSQINTLVDTHVPGAEARMAVATARDGFTFYQIGEDILLRSP